MMHVMVDIVRLVMASAPASGSHQSAGLLWQAQGSRNHGTTFHDMP
jgi:hypothetical protein